MDMSFVIRQRLQELQREQRDLAAAAQVTESYISQLLSRKKAPPATERTGLYDRMDAFLEFPRGHLAAMAQAQRLEDLKRKLDEIPTPLFREAREFVLGKCRPESQGMVREIFEKQAFGELERLVSQSLLAAAKGVAREGLKDEKWLRRAGKLRRQSREDLRAEIQAFLDTDVLNISVEQCSSFLNPLIESWQIDLKNFNLEVHLSKRLASGGIARFRYAEASAFPGAEEEPGFKDFLRNPGMSGGASDEELAFLKSLKFHRLRPSALYYYRELQSLRDPLHFPSSSTPGKSLRRDTRRIGNASQRSPGKRAFRP